jgi:outer membrane protein assembly factor BamB
MIMKYLLLSTLLLICLVGTAQTDTTSRSHPDDMEKAPKLLWKYKAGGSLVGTPVIADSLVFIGSTDSTLYALEMTTGKLRWRLPTGGAIRSSVCLAPERLYLLSGDGLLYRITRDSGYVDGLFRTINSYMGERQNDYADYYHSTPVLGDTALYFGAGGTVYSLSLTDGLINWSYKTGDVIHTSPVISNKRLYVSSFDGHVYAFDLRTGNLVWKFKSNGRNFFPQGEMMGNPAVGGGMVYAGSRDYTLYAIDMKGGYCNWTRQFPRGWALPVTFRDTVLYVGTSDDHELYALDFRTGYEYWKLNVGFNILGGMALGKKLGYFATLAGKVHAVDLTSGDLEWSVELDGYKANRAKYLKSDDKYRDDIGKLLKTPLDLIEMYRRLGAVFSAPAYIPGYLIVAGFDGWVYCFGPSNTP